MLLPCQKAKKWLDGKDIAYTERNIAEENPTYEELKEWYEKSGLPLKKFFNTSGLLYKSMQLKDNRSITYDFPPWIEFLSKLDHDAVAVIYLMLDNLGSPAYIFAVLLLKICVQIVQHEVDHCNGIVI